MADETGFAAALVINGFTALLLYFLFCLFRNRFPKIYNPRKLLNESRASEYATPPGTFSWISRTFFMSDDEFYTLAGMDALIYTGFFR